MAKNLNSNQIRRVIQKAMVDGHPMTTSVSKKGKVTVHHDEDIAKRLKSCGWELEPASFR